VSTIDLEALMADLKALLKIEFSEVPDDFFDEMDLGELVMYAVTNGVAFSDTDVLSPEQAAFCGRAAAAFHDGGEDDLNAFIR
jgi:hypothetical protein